MHITNNKEYFRGHLHVYRDRLVEFRVISPSLIGVGASRRGILDHRLFVLLPLLRKHTQANLL